MRSRPQQLGAARVSSTVSPVRQSSCRRTRRPRSNRRSLLSALGAESRSLGRASARTPGSAVASPAASVVRLGSPTPRPDTWPQPSKSHSGRVSVTRIVPRPAPASRAGAAAPRPGARAPGAGRCPASTRGSIHQRDDGSRIAGDDAELARRPLPKRLDEGAQSCSASSRCGAVSPSLGGPTCVAMSAIAEQAVNRDAQRGATWPDDLDDRLGPRLPPVNPRQSMPEPRFLQPCHQVEPGEQTHRGVGARCRRRLARSPRPAAPSITTSCATLRISEGEGAGSPGGARAGGGRRRVRDKTLVRPPDRTRRGCKPVRWVGHRPPGGLSARPHPAAAQQRRGERTADTRSRGRCAARSWATGRSSLTIRSSAPRRGKRALMPAKD